MTKRNKSTIINDIPFIRWAEAIGREIETNGYSKTTILSRLIEQGPQGSGHKSSTIPIPGYWPDSEVRQVNDYIQSLNTKDRNLLCLLYIMRCSLQAAGEQLGITRHQARHRKEYLVIQFK